MYLRARQYSPGLGRFLTRDTWGGTANRPGSFNRWNYVEGNPVMSKDPTGLFAISTIMSNLPQGIPGDDEYGIGGQDHNAHKMRWGLLALLITANEGDYFRLGALELENKQGPSIGYYKWNMFWMVNCDTIMVGNQRLEDFWF